MFSKSSETPCANDPVSIFGGEECQQTPRRHIWAYKRGKNTHIYFASPQKLCRYIYVSTHPSRYGCIRVVNLWLVSRTRKRGRTEGNFRAFFFVLSFAQVCGEWGIRKEGKKSAIYTGKWQRADMWYMKVNATLFWFFFFHFLFVTFPASLMVVIFIHGIRII